MRRFLPKWFVLGCPDLVAFHNRRATRRCLLVGFLLVMIQAVAQQALAADWAVEKLSNGWSGLGYYFHWGHLITCWLVFLAWVHTTDWVSQDAVAVQMDHVRWNAIVFGTFIGTFLLMFLIPSFWPAFFLLAVAYVAPLSTYIVFRNRHVVAENRVLTPAHLRYWFSEKAALVGIKIAAEKEDPHHAGVSVLVKARGGATDRDNSVRDLAARQAPGLFDVRKLLNDGLTRRADAVMIDCTPQTAAVSHFIDGVWHTAEPLEREVADPIIEAMKILCGLNVQDRQGKQEGRFGLEYTVLKKNVFSQIEKVKDEYRRRVSIDLTKEFAGQDPPLSPEALQAKVAQAAEVKAREKFAQRIGPWTPLQKSEVSKVKFVDNLNPDLCLDTIKANATMLSQGVPTGERVVVQIEIVKPRFGSLDELGMRPKMQEQLKQLIGSEKGMFLFSSMPTGGLRTTTAVTLSSLDRLIREFVAVEDEGNRYDSIENVPATTYKASGGETPATVLPILFHKEPQVIVIRDLVNAETVKLLCQDIPRGRFVLSTIRAKDAAEAIYRVAAMGIPLGQLAPHMLGVLSQRLVRRLCEHCREAYVPSPDVLAQLGIPAGRVQTFYRPPQQAADADVCPNCGGTGYFGRTAVFELLVLNDALRQVLTSGAKLDAFRQAARKAGMRNLQEEGLLLVAKGVTALPELARVLK